MGYQKVICTVTGQQPQDGSKVRSYKQSLQKICHNENKKIRKLQKHKTSVVLVITLFYNSPPCGLSYSQLGYELIPKFEQNDNNFYNLSRCVAKWSRKGRLQKKLKKWEP
jgi:non-homologous end joining protein Ku